MPLSPVVLLTADTAARWPPAWADAELELQSPETFTGATSSDVLVIDPSVSEPLKAARAFRRFHPSGQVLFLAPPGRLERLQRALPFAPELSDATVLDATIGPEELQRRVEEARRAVQQRNSIRGLYSRINSRVGVGRPAAVEAERAREHRALAERYLAAILNHAPDALVAVAPDGEVVSWNEAAARVFGRSFDDLAGRPFLHLFSLEDDRRRAARLLDRALLGETVTGEEFHLNGRQWVEISAGPVLGGSGAIEGVSLTARDVTDRKRAEDALRESQRRLNAVLNNASVSIFLMNEHQHCVYLNAAAEHLTGYTLAEVQGQPLHDLIHHTRPDGSHYPLEECPIDRAFPEEHQTQGEEVFVHKSGRFYPVAFTASPIWDEATKTVGTIIEVRDISAEKRAQEHQRLLINELNHRVKNTLATVQSIALQTLRSASGTEEAKEGIERRLIALSEAHDVLTRENWEGADLDEVVARAVAPYETAERGRFSVEGPAVRLRPAMALALSMALQELATNALKYGSLSTSGGRVLIRWSTDAARAPPWLHLRWEERGGPEVKHPTRRGFGTRLIERSLAQDLDGDVHIDFAPTGVVCTVDAPLT